MQTDIELDETETVEVDCDICSECGEHAEFIQDGKYVVSNCCGASAYNTDYEYDMER